MSEREFDVVVLGAGPAGEVCAGRLGEAGLSVAIVEPHLIGGECSFYACMPSKALLRPGELLAEVRRIPGVSEAVTGDLDVDAVLKRRDEIIHGLDDSHMVPWLEERGVAVVRGAGRIEGERRVAVGHDTLVARRAVVVATGSAPLVPPIDGLREAKPWTNREATTSKEIPARLAILGGGVVGVAIGRQPNTTDIGVESIGREPGKPIEVNDSMQAEDWLYAIGDANGRALLTHMGKYQARIAADVILQETSACLPTTARGSLSPRVIFTDPHVAAVGYTLDAAQQAGLNVRAVDVSTQGSAGASFYGRDDARGTTRLVVDDDRSVIVGATFTGPEVADFLHAATIAVVGEVPLERLFHAVPAFPTRSEVWLYLLEALGIAGPCGAPPRA